MPATLRQGRRAMPEIPAPTVADLYARAGLLSELGRTEEARDAYLAALALEPNHFGALNGLGNLLYRTDFRSAARVAYGEAVRHHPDNPVGRINLANALLADGMVDDARRQYQAALDLAPDHPDAHQGMANLLQGLGEADAADRHLRLSLAGRTVEHRPYRGEGPPCRVLLLVSAVGGNVPTRFILNETRFAVAVLAVEAHAALAALPPHDLVFNAVGDADLCGSALTDVEAILKRTPAPVVNPPDRVRTTGRLAVMRLGQVPDVVAPMVAVAARENLAEAAQAFGWPLLLRSIGFHAGQHFRKADTPTDLPAVADALPGRELLLIEYLDVRDAAGLSRKYRVMFIDGQMFPMHLAISSDWKVHYFTAQMAEQAAYRAEETAFLADMERVLGQCAIAALTAICESLGLDYAGIDFALDKEGRVVLFETNATMVVNPPDTAAEWAYRRAPTQRILDAAQAMLLSRANIA